jgi:hypothetical protein
MATDVQLGQKAEDLEFSHDQLLQQPGEAPEAYVDRLSKVPKLRLDKFEKDEEERQYQQAVVPQPDEDTETFATRLASSLSPEQLDRFEQEQERQAELQQETEKYRQHKLLPDVVGAPLVGATAGAFGLAAAPVMAAKAGLDTLAQWLNNVPEEQKKSWSDRYNKEMLEWEAFKRSYKQDSPYLYGGAELVGMGVGLGKLSKMIPPSTLKQSLLLDGTYSAMTGATESEAKMFGKHADATQVLQDAASQGVQGLALGAAIRYAASGTAKKIKSWSEDYLINKLGKVGVALDSEVAKVVEAKKSVDSALLTEVKKPLTDFKTWRQSTSPEVKGMIALEAPNTVRKAASKFGVADADMTDWLAYRTVKQSQKDLNRWLSSNGFKGGVEEALQSAKAGYVDDSFAWVRQGKYAQDLLNKGLIEVADSKLGSKLTRLAMIMADGRYVTDAIDSKWGTKLTVYLDNLSQKYNKFTQVSAGFEAANEKAFKLARKTNLFKDQVTYFSKYADENVTSNKLMAALESEQVRNTLTKDEQVVVGMYQDLFKAMKDKAKDLGLDIKDIKDYLTVRAASPEKYVKAVKDRLSSFSKELADPLQFEKTSSYAYSSSPENTKKFQELLTSLQRLNDGKPVKTYAQFKQAVKSLEQPFSKIYKGLTRASATYKREGGLPSFVRETDVPKLVSGYIRNTFYNLHLADDILKMKGVSNQIGGKDPLAKVWIDNLVQDVTGTRDTFAYNMKNLAASIEANLKQKIEDAPSLAKKALYTAELVAPKVATFMVHQIYPSTMGLNPRIIIRNLTQPWLMTAGEISGMGEGLFKNNASYGMKKILRSQADIFALKNMNLKDAEGKTFSGIHNLAKMLKNEGQMPSKLQWESAEDAIKSGMASVFKKGVDFANDITMAGFAGSEIHNRAVSWFAGLHIGDDVVSALKKVGKNIPLTKNEEAGLNFVRSMQAGYRVEMKETFSKFLKNPSDEQAEFIRKRLGRYLVAKTQFNYDRIALSEFGRSMGWMFTMFTKWPTSISSDIVAKVKNFEKQGGFKIATQYWAPLVASTAVDKMFEEGLNDPNSRARLLLGRSTSDALPIQAATQLSDPLRSSIAVDLLLSGGQSLASRDPQQISKFAERLFRQHTFGSQYIRFATEDLPTLLEGKNPKTIHEMFKVEGD